MENLEGRQLLSAGMLDPSFGVGGMTRVDVPGPAFDQAVAAVQAPDGSGNVPVAGESDNRFVLARYTAGGALVGEPLVTGFRGIVESMALTSDGVVIAGSVDVGTAMQPDGAFAVVKFKTDGSTLGYSVDSKFGTGGLAVANPTESVDDLAYGVAVDSLGDIVLSGGPQEGGSFAVARFTSAGALDMGWGGSGIVTTQVTTQSGYSDLGRGVAIDSKDRVVVVGSAVDDTGANCVAVLRYTPDGNLDKRLGDGGMVLTEVVTGESSGMGITPVVLSDDSILVGGRWTPAAPICSWRSTRRTAG